MVSPEVLEALYRLQWTSTDGLGILIISPTRELAYQTFEVLRKVGKNHDFSAGLIIGGKVCPSVLILLSFCYLCWSLVTVHKEEIEIPSRQMIPETRLHGEAVTLVCHCCLEPKIVISESSFCQVFDLICWFL